MHMRMRLLIYSYSYKPRSAQQQREQEQHRLCTGAQADVITVMSTLRAKLAKWDQGTT